MIKLVGKTLIFSDLHVGIKSDTPSRLNMSIIAVEEILKIASTENIDNIIFLGDWFNSREYIHTATLTIGYQLISLLASRHTVVVIAGNHDIESNSYNTISPLYTFTDIDNVHIFHDITEFMLNDKICLAVPWGHSEYDNNQLYDIVFGHLNVAGSAIRYNKVVGEITDNSEYVVTSINDVRTFAKKLKPSGICFSGHIHLKTEHRYRSTRIIFVGSPIELNFGEMSSSHGVYILDTDTNNVHFNELYNAPKHAIMRLSECIDETRKIKSDDYFSRFNNTIIKKIIDVDLSHEQQTELNNRLTNLNIYDFVESEICYTGLSTEISTSVAVEKLTLMSYIDLVFDTLSDDVFKQAETTKDSLKDIFKTYTVEYNI